MCFLKVLVVERRVEVPTVVQVEVPVPKTPETGSSEMTSVNFSRSVSSNSGSNGQFVSRYIFYDNFLKSLFFLINCHFI